MGHPMFAGLRGSKALKLLAALLVAIVMAVVCAVLLRRGANLMKSRAEKVAAALEEETPWTGPPIA